MSQSRKLATTPLETWNITQLSDSIKKKYEDH